ncbi:MAG TPA: adenylate/guanylate cyclase domain-containing protein [Enterovirga sp.]|nr:adenylate/guanylate cyclase domain-containing protein [Enterovirga sp.]
MQDTTGAGRGMRFRIGFQPSITTLFVAVVLLVGLTLVTLSFERATAITRSAALTFIDRVADHTRDRVDGQFTDVLSGLQLLRQLPPVQDGAISNNQSLYAVLAALLRNHGQLYNVYIGYDDGKFIELDSLPRAGPAVRAQVGAPEGAEFRLTVFDRDPGQQQRTRTTIFLSSDLRIISEARRAADYDPRERPWYRGAFDLGAGAVTDPYVFKGVALTGYTVRVPFPAAIPGIVAGDMLLADTDAFLKEQRLGQSGEVFLFDDNGRVIAHPRMSEVLSWAKSADGTLALPQLDEIETVDIKPPLRAWQSGGPSQQIFTASGRTYVAAFRSVEAAGSAKLRLAVVAPLDEFFAEIEQARRSLLLVTLGLVAAALPAAFWLGSVVSRSIKRLAYDTDRIRRFQLGDTARVRSVIREIDDLGRSVATMRTVLQTFASFVPKHLVQGLVESGTPMKPGGARREVTILFSDVEGFTHITERADPERVMLYTSRYFAVLSRAIMEHNGTIDKFAGDCVMAIWNAPADDPDHVVNACAAALACKRASEELNAAFEREGWPAYKTRFGLHTGEAVVGNVGSDDRMNYTVLGPTVNLAARLEGLNKTYDTAILVSEAVATRAAGRFSFRGIDTIRPKGFAESVQVFALAG